MSLLTPELALKLWYDAMQEEIGVAIRVATKDKVVIRSALYKARDEIGDERLKDYGLFSPNGDELFIVKKTAELPECRNI